MNNSENTLPQVGIIMGSQSDLKIMENAALALEQLHICPAWWPP